MPGTSSNFHEVLMSKKTARRSAPKHSNVRALHADVRPWEMPPRSEPREEDRDQRYVRYVRPKTEMKRAFIEALDAFHMALALGPAGTGKTYLSIAKAVEALDAGEIQRIVLTRPAMEAGECKRKWRLISDLCPTPCRTARRANTSAN